MFQHTARFIYVTTTVNFIVTAAIHWGLSSRLRPACAGLTPPLDLPALGRCQSLYRVIVTSQRHVFLLNSQLTLFTVSHQGWVRRDLTSATTPSSEVTGLFCRVP